MLNVGKRIPYDPLQDRSGHQQVVVHVPISITLERFVFWCNTDKDYKYTKNTLIFIVEHSDQTSL